MQQLIQKKSPYARKCLEALVDGFQKKSSFDSCRMALMELSLDKPAFTNIYFTLLVWGRKNKDFSSASLSSLIAFIDIRPNFFTSKHIDMFVAELNNADQHIANQCSSILLWLLNQRPELFFTDI